MTVVCTFCSGPVEPAGSYRRVTGWERRSLTPSRRGGSDIVLRQPLDEWACSRCVGMLRDGLSVGQGSLPL